MNDTLSGDLPPPDFNLGAAIQHELSIAGGHADPEEIGERVVRNIPDGCLRAVMVHELMPKRVASEAERMQTRRAGDGVVLGREQV